MSKSVLHLLTILLLLLTNVQLSAQIIANTDKIHQSLWQEMQREPNAYKKIRIVLKDRIDMEQMDAELYARKATLEERAYEVITRLQQKAAATQPVVLAALAKEINVKQESTQALWITNLILAEAKPEAVMALSLREDIDWIEWDADAKLEKYTRSESCEELTAINGAEPGLKAIKAPFMWALGYTGNGKVLMTIDTGVDYTHPAINNQWRGNYVPASQAWYYPAGASLPIDCDEHGTHTVGTMVGLDPSTKDTIGVAFGATWIGGPGITCPNSSRIALFQWSLNPDNNANTISDMPDAINNSWYDSNVSNECASNNAYKLVFDACEAAGIAVVFSAGNNGPNASTITKPKNISTTLVNVFCVANINGNNPAYLVESSSSRGPSACGGTGSFLIKPEVSAPGADVRSCIPGANYAKFTGTSMAAPHASGAIALLRQAFPTLTGSEIKLALYYSCTDLGTPGEDNDYGMGLINLEAAYNYLIQQGNTPVSPTVANNISVIGIQNLPASACTDSIAPLFSFKNNGTSPLTSANIVYKLSNGFVDSVAWTGNLAAGASTFIPIVINNLAPGFYNLTIYAKSPNGQADQAVVDNKIEQNFKLNIGINISTNAASICTGNSTQISATSNPPATIAWFSAANSSNVLDSTGGTFTTPILTATKTYYADAYRYAHLGKMNNSTGNGNYSGSLTSYLIFDAIQAFTLQEVTVYASTSGTRMFEVRNANGLVLNSKSVNLPVGESRVSLNFQIPSGEDLRLGISTLADLYQSTSGVSYPYSAYGVVNIKGASNMNSYVYFYDWKIAYGSACGRIPTMVKVNPTPALTATASSQNIDLNVTGLVNFTASSATAVTYQWSFGDGGASTQQNPSHTYTSTGVYTATCIVTDSNACTKSQNITITVTQGVDIDMPTALGNISIAPNPTQGLVSLDLQLSSPKEVSFEVHDAVGRTLFVMDNRLYKEDKISLDFSKYAAGTYFLTISVKGEGLWVKRIIKD